MKLSWRPPSAIFFVISSFVIGGCASSEYMVIALLPGQANPALQQLAQRARASDKQAQLELGVTFEEGRGIEINQNFATSMYRLAAKDSPGTLWVYAPSPGGSALAM